jgi:endonuclease G
LDEKGLRVPRTVNEGVRISAIVLDLETRRAALAAPARGLVDEAMKLGIDKAPTPAQNEAADGAKRYDDGHAVVAVTVAPDGTATWHIPLAVSVRLGGVPGAARAEAPAEPAPSPPPDDAPPGGEAKLELDEDYSNRSGYDPAFLQSVTIPLPKLSSDQEVVAATNKEPRDGDDPTWLRYEHFTVVMNGKRRLAFFSAVNIDGSRSKDLDRETGKITDASGPADDEDEAAEAAELWFSDRRIDDHEQTPPDFYSGQTTFDAAGRRIVNRQTSDHRNRMFQQGHLTRRQDPLWGLDEVVIRANADTFHVTNRSPQVGYFNMGIRKSDEEAKKHFGGTLYWRALEEYVLQNARADRKRVTVFTGPALILVLTWPLPTRSRPGAAMKPTDGLSRTSRTCRSIGHRAAREHAPSVPLLAGACQRDDRTRGARRDVIFLTPDCLGVPTYGRLLDPPAGAANDAGPSFAG